MSVNDVLSNAGFDSETVELMAAALDKTWKIVNEGADVFTASDRAAASRDNVALQIVFLAQSGERNERHLIERALARLGIPYTSGSEPENRIGGDRAPRI